MAGAFGSARGRSAATLAQTAGAISSTTQPTWTCGPGAAAVVAQAGHAAGAGVGIGATGRGHGRAAGGGFGSVRTGVWAAARPPTAAAAASARTWRANRLGMGES